MAAATSRPDEVDPHSMSRQSPEDGNEGPENRTLANLVALVAVLVLIVLGYWAFTTLDHSRRFQRCLDFRAPKLRGLRRSRQVSRNIGPRNPLANHARQRNKNALALAWLTASRLTAPRLADRRWAPKYGPSQVRRPGLGSRHGMAVRSVVRLGSARLRLAWGSLSGIAPFADRRIRRASVRPFRFRPARLVARAGLAGPGQGEAKED